MLFHVLELHTVLEHKREADAGLGICTRTSPVWSQSIADLWEWGAELRGGSGVFDPHGNTTLEF